MFSLVYFCIGIIYLNKFEICLLLYEIYCVWSGCFYGRVWFYVFDVNYYISYRVCFDCNYYCFIICCIFGNVISKWSY